MSYKGKNALDNLQNILKNKRDYYPKVTNN